MKAKLSSYQNYQNKILSECRSKNRVWKIISFLYTNRPKKNFPDFSRL